MSETDDRAVAAARGQTVSPDELQETPSLYANGFQFGWSNADTWILLQLVGQPVLRVHMSYTLAKTLATKLSAAVEEFEARTKRDLLTTDEVQAAYEGDSDAE